MRMARSAHLYPILIYLFGLGLLLMNTLPTNYLLGTDIHLEYYFAQRTLANGWDSSLPHPVNGALGATLLAPVLSRITTIPLVWIFKAVYPMIFAVVPVLLYFLWTRFFSKREAFLASLFFILVPAFMIELTGLGRQQIAEVLLVLYFMVLLGKAQPFLRIPSLMLIGIAVAAAHYSTGIVLIVLTMLYCGYLYTANRHETIFPARQLLIALLAITVGSIVFWGWAGGGTPLRYMTHLIPIEEHKIGPYKIGRIPADEALAVSNLPAEITTGPIPRYDPLMRVATGMDFGKASVQGKLFRIVQLITQLSIVIGAVHVLRSHRIARTYKVAMLSGMTVLITLVIVPEFAAMLNATRWYHLMLFATAPTLVVAYTRVLKKSYILMALLVIYGAFTTGLIFEASGTTDISNPNVPYSVGLSGQRLGIAGNFTSDDEIVRHQLANGQSELIYSDIGGTLFLQETMALEKKLFVWDGVQAIRDGAVFFSRSAFTSTGNLLVGRGVGARATVVPDMSDWTEAYSAGTSKVLTREQR